MVAQRTSGEFRGNRTVKPGDASEGHTSHEFTQPVAADSIGDNLVVADRVGKGSDYFERSPADREGGELGSADFDVAIIDRTIKVES